MKKLICYLLTLPALIFAQSFTDSPFKTESQWSDDTLSVTITIPADHLIYEQSLHLLMLPGRTAIAPTQPPVTHLKKDPFSDEKIKVLTESQTLHYTVAGDPPLLLLFQGCNKTLCFMPEEIKITKPNAKKLTAKVQQPIVKVQQSIAPDNSEKWRSVADQFEITRISAGYMKTPAFLEFLGAPASNKQVTYESAWSKFIRDPEAFMQQQGIWLTAFFILLGGFLLNLTPCVLPMIPVNLAIIGAKGIDVKKGQGLQRGLLYGLGMAVVYGSLGLVVILGGGSFGTINASPIFNLVIAVIFIGLSLAMLDIINIDFSNFQNKFNVSSQLGGFSAFLMGGVAALLAGACVAPVLLAVLLLSVTIYKVTPFGLFLPFLLGIGMGLPWPFLGAGIAALPKPGMWMERVKKVFAALILLLAAYYGYTAWHLNRVNTAANLSEINQHFAKELQEALDQNETVVIDFWATWCKNCTAMKQTTFKNPEVRKQLEGFRLIEYQAEQPSAPETAAVMEYFHARGLPTFLILTPKEK